MMEVLLMKSAANIQLFSHVRFVDKLLFTKHLAVMIKSGVTLIDALDTLQAQAKSGLLPTIIREVQRDIENGKSLAEALKKHPKVFDQFYISLVAIGEESGTLEENLEYLATQLSKEYALRKKVVGAMLYPSLVLVAASVMGMGMSLFVLPKLIDLFESLDVALPLMTKILLFVATIMRDYGVIIFAGLFVFIILFRIAIAHPAIKPHWHAFLLSLPVIGQFLQYAYVASLCRNIGIMLRSGLPITRAFEIEYTISSNVVFKQYAKQLQRAIDKGDSLATELSSGKYNNIPAIATKMIGVGEKTGKLDETLIYLGEFFDGEVDDAAKNFSTVLEPIMLFGIALIVGFVALAIISPIYQLTGSIRR